jgi:hypothetical protein
MQKAKRFSNIAASSTLPMRNELIERMRAQCSRWLDNLLFWLFLTLGTRMFGCIATWTPNKKLKAIHFAVSRDALDSSIRALSMISECGAVEFSDHE